MNPFRRIRDFFLPEPRMIGTPPSARQTLHDSADHAKAFAHRWVDRLEEYAGCRMEDLGIPDNQIGSPDHKHGIKWCSFNPHERDGGGNSTGGRLNVDSGVLDLEFHAEVIGLEAHATWKRSRLRDRIDASIAHEYEEAKWDSHEYAVEHAPETELPIGDRVRALLREIRTGEQATRGGGSSHAL